MKYRIAMGLSLALVFSLLIGLTAAWAVGEEKSAHEFGLFSGNPVELLKEKPVTGAVMTPLAPQNSSPNRLPIFFVLSIGLMMVTTTAIVTSKELFPNPPTG